MPSRVNSLPEIIIIHQKINILRTLSVDTKFLLFNHCVTKAEKTRK